MKFSTSIYLFIYLGVYIYIYVYNGAEQSKWEEDKRNGAMWGRLDSGEYGIQESLGPSAAVADEETTGKGFIY